MYEIEVIEILSRKVMIEADNVETAIQQVKEEYYNEEIILDYLDFQEVKFIDSKKKEYEHQLMIEIIDYLYQNEERHYKELNEPNEHVFLKIRTLKDMVINGK